MDHICYSAKADLNDLNGDYRIVMAIRNGDYYDLFEIDNRFNTQYEVYENDNTYVSFFTDSVRYRLMMNVKKD